MFPRMKFTLGLLGLCSLFIISACTDQEAEKRAQMAEERAIAAEKRAVIAEEKLLMLEKKLKDDEARSEANKKFTEGRYEKSPARAW